VGSAARRAGEEPPLKRSRGEAEAGPEGGSRVAVKPEPHEEPPGPPRAASRWSALPAHADSPPSGQEGEADADAGRSSGRGAAGGEQAAERDGGSRRGGREERGEREGERPRGAREREREGWERERPGSSRRDRDRERPGAAKLEAGTEAGPGPGAAAAAAGRVPGGEEAGGAAVWGLVGRGRLVLVVDLDACLADSVWDAALDGPTAAALSRRAGHEAASLPLERRELFRLPLDGGPAGPGSGGLWLKLRPGCRALLGRAAERFELWAHTRHGRGYAEALLGLLDPLQQVRCGRAATVAGAG
jgi:hypothetical protein